MKKLLSKTSSKQKSGRARAIKQRRSDLREKSGTTFLLRIFFRHFGDQSWIFFLLKASYERLVTIVLLLLFGISTLLLLGVLRSALVQLGINMAMLLKFTQLDTASIRNMTLLLIGISLTLMLLFLRSTLILIGICMNIYSTASTRNLYGIAVQKTNINTDLNRV